MLSTRFGNVASSGGVSVAGIFKAIGYTGNGAPQSITGVGFQPDLTWIKNRDAADFHVLTDSVRGVTKYLKSNGGDTETTDVNSLTSSDTGGFSIGTQLEINTNTEDYVAWCFKKDPEAFDIVPYTGNGIARDIAHNMSVAPEMMLVKGVSVGVGWQVYHTGLNGGTTPEDFHISLDSTAGEINAADRWNDTATTSSVFSLGNSVFVNNDTSTYIAYLFASKEGVSKVGSYVGTGAAGNFVDCGFDPAFVMVKARSVAANWEIFDSARGDDLALQPNTTNAEQGVNVDLVSGGFTLQANDGTNNGSGTNMIFLAFA